MTWAQRIVLLVLGFGLLGLVLYLKRKRRLRDGYAVFWVATSILLLLFVVLSGLVVRAASWLDLDGAVVMLAVVSVFLAAVALHHSVMISEHSQREQELSQEVAGLKEELETLREEVRQPPPPPSEPKPKPPSLRT